MKNPAYFLILVSLICTSCVVLPVYQTHISLKETKCKEHRVPITNLLLIGSGPVASRVFLDNLSSKMIQAFKAQGVHADFSYVGKLSQSSLYRLDSLVSDQYDTYLLFKASDSSFLDMNKVKQVVIGPGISGASYGNQYVETYKLFLYQKAEKLGLVWQGNLKVDFDLANANKYKQVSQLILKELSKDGQHPE
jgi:hypothetical protein